MKKNVEISVNEIDLKLESYDYELPKQLIAQRPMEPRDHSKLMIVDVSKGSIVHDKFFNLSSYIEADSTLVFNNTKVFPCRMFAKKPTGGNVEIFFLQVPAANIPLSALVKASGKRSVGEKFLIQENQHLEVVEVLDGKIKLNISSSALEVVKANTLVPIPPYIRDGISDEKDISDYQTIYADDKNTGSVAAPTAGLHFTDRVFKSLKDKRVSTLEVNLNVGLGTFAPVKVDDLTDHEMHSEDYSVTKENLETVKNKYGNLIAVGTTSLRVLESLNLESYEANKIESTNIFLYPGKEVRSIKGLITNFHLPKSTLLMLVSSLVGRERALELYKTAIENQYRFFSYGDAMYIKLDKS